MPYNKPKDNEIDYLVKRIPREIWEEAQTFAAMERPPLSMRWVVISLVERWVEARRAELKDRMPPQAEKPKPKKPHKPVPPRSVKPVKPKAAAPVPAPVPMRPSTPPGAPDLGDAF